MADRTGQQLGNYRILRLLGKGGFAEVYLGEHIYLQTWVAIKVLDTQLTPGDMQGFLSEARTIARLAHPHIVRVIDFGRDGESPFLVMDYAPHGTLRQRYPRGTILPLSTVILYAGQAATALQHAHNHHIIHRDIKPENMLLGQQDELLLSDFGIATLFTAPPASSHKTWSVPSHTWHPNRSRGNRARPATSIHWLSSCTSG